MRSIVVNVTIEDIRRGDPENCQRCPIALGICRALGLPVDAVTVACVIRATMPDGQSWVFDLPDIACAFVDSFDIFAHTHRALFKSISFPLALPDDFPLALEVA